MCGCGRLWSVSERVGECMSEAERSREEKERIRTKRERKAGAEDYMLRGVLGRHGRGRTYACASERV